MPPGTTNTGMSFSRLNTDGSFDPAFSSNGRRIYSFTGFNTTGRGIVILADGTSIGVGNISDGRAVAIKMTDAGSDQTFGSSGAFTSLFGTSGASFNAVAVLSDGSIIAAGSAGGNFLVAKLTPAGALDGTFGSGGFVTTDFGGTDVAAGVAIQPDGKIVAGGRTGNATALARYSATGALDSSFGTNGKVVSVIVNGNPGYPNEILLQPDGKIVGIGIAAPNGFERHLLVRYTASGALDPTFGTNGVAGGYFGNPQEFLTGGKILANGKIIAVGYVGRNATIARYNADGSVDRSFLCGGFGWVYFNSNLTLSYFYDVAVQADGKYVAVGQATSPTVSQNSFAFARFNAAATPTQCAPADFDRDGVSDISVIRPDNGAGNSVWYKTYSSGVSNNFEFNYSSQFGLATDKYAPADYDGDGKTDLAVWRENVAGNQAYFWILNSTNSTVRTEPFGLTGDKLTVGDWDGDGQADLSVYRDGAQSYFFYRGSFNNPNADITYLPWGVSGDQPLRGDFDGDGKSDPAVYRAADQTWYLRNSSNGQTVYRYFGLASDRLVPADYDGDGRTDVAVFRPSNAVWYILNSSNSQVSYQTFGLATDSPAPADYDGDGRTDIAVFRSGAWFINQSSNGQILYPQFGQTGDIPVAAAFTP
jgi:uncharacterized delta-60 repeat protein